jgi:xanthine dehydrogenase YagT iron-sulfur-binding subunit
MPDQDPKLIEDKEEPQGVSRRDFLKISAITVTVPAVAGPRVLEVGGEQVAVVGPGKTAITLMVNGKALRTELEPRVTLLDALRQEFDLTGAKRICDRAECGSCTVLMDGRAVYACTVLAVDAQGHNITTIEGLAQGETLNAVSAAFVANDAQQCGFCTPGFIMATKALINKHPHPTHEQVVKGLSGNLCRCGTYVGMKGAMEQLAKSHAAPAASKTPAKGA